MVSGFAPGGSAETFGAGLVRVASAVAADGGGLAGGGRGAAFPAAPAIWNGWASRKPETWDVAFGLPPEMLTPVLLLPSPPVRFPPPKVFGPPRAAPVTPGAWLFKVPPGVPGFAPSGEIARRAERFPCTKGSCGCGGAGGAEKGVKGCDAAGVGGGGVRC